MRSPDTILCIDHFCLLHLHVRQNPEKHFISFCYKKYLAAVIAEVNLRLFFRFSVVIAYFPFASFLCFVFLIYLFFFSKSLSFEGTHVYMGAMDTGVLQAKPLILYIVAGVSTL